MADKSPLTEAEQQRIKLMKARRDFAIEMDRFHMAIQAAVKDPPARADRARLVEQGRFFRARFGDYMAELARSMEWACSQPAAGTIKEAPDVPDEPM